MQVNVWIGCRFSRAIVAIAAVMWAACAAAEMASGSTAKVVHVVVALADNEYQGIAPVPRALGNGDDAARNLYWGARYGVRTVFQRSPEWRLDSCRAGEAPIIERCTFKHRHQDAVVVADAYRGREIARAIEDFLSFAAGQKVEALALRDGRSVQAGGASRLVAYVGHDGLMELKAALHDGPADAGRQAIILACSSKYFFAEALKPTGATPILWTTGLMAPEAYVLEAALAGWVEGEQPKQIRDRAVTAYDQYQRCGLKAARALFATGW